MKSGGSLRVTAEHPLLTDDGIMRQAEDLKVGASLVRADGSPDAISSVEVSKIFGKVYNVRPTTVDYTSNIVVAGGYLNGSVRYQNEFLDMINALILRRALADIE
jgi:intein/homing endonuclease